MKSGMDLGTAGADWMLLERIWKIIPVICTPRFKLLGLLMSKMLRIIYPQFEKHSPLYHALWACLINWG